MNYILTTYLVKAFNLWFMPSFQTFCRKHNQAVIIFYQTDKNNENYH